MAPIFMGMAEPHVISALVAKQAVLAGERDQLDRRRDALQAHIDHIDGTLRLFAYPGDPAKIETKRPYRWIFRRGELRRLVSDIERTAPGPLHTEAIAIAITNRKGWGATPELVESIAGRIKQARRR